MEGAVPNARFPLRSPLCRAVLWVALALATLPLAAAQTYRPIGTAELAVDGVVKRFEAYEVASEVRTVFTATWETGGFIAGDMWWIDVVMWEHDETAPGAREGEALLMLTFFVDPATGAVVSGGFRETDVSFVPAHRETWPLYASLRDQARVTIESFAWEGDVLSLRGNAVAVLGLVAGAETDEPDPTQTITVEVTFDLWEVVPMVY